jgi:TetR/AcrR family acrAB operon transcriptional repressor
MKRTKEEAALTRQMLLDAALQVFNHKGYAQTTLEEIAKEAGVTRGALYWHFNNKFEMFQMVLQGVYEKVSERILEIVESDQSALNKLQNLFQEFYLILSNREEYRVIEELYLFKDNSGDKFSQLYKDHEEKARAFRESLKSIALEGIAAGEFDNRLEPELIIMAMMSFIAGMKSAWLSGINSISIKENVESLANIFIKGISS